MKCHLALLICFKFPIFPMSLELKIKPTGFGEDNFGEELYYKFRIRIRDKQKKSVLILLASKRLIKFSILYM